jgi:LCP family protein required for cell wall assembly
LPDLRELGDLPERRGIWKRYVAGALTVLVAASAATAVAGFNQLDKVAAVFDNELQGIEGELAEAPPGKPQTILLLGSDRRARTSNDVQSGAISGTRADTMILMRLDPERDAIALLSLPRDLKVRIPGVGVDKLNAAYQEGGTKLTLQTIKDVTGLRVNHVINIDFGGFQEAVDAIGCVYADVDRRYFNDNSGVDQYATININPGYQKLCGRDALDYVRYRHTDSDIVRAARQQDFLRSAKAQVSVGRLIDDEERLLKIVNKYTRSDIEGRKQVLTLLKLALNSAGSPIQEIHFPAEIGASYVTADADEVRKATREFLGVQATKGPRAEPEPVEDETEEQEKERKSERTTGSTDLIDISAGGRQQGMTLAQNLKGLRIYYPRRGVKFTQFSINSPRAYRICNGGKCYRSYRMVLQRSNLIGEYYGIQGTKWRNPPILKEPSETKRIGRREFELFYDGDRLRLVAWREKDAVYWVSNTLLQSISEREMLAIARYSRPL